MPTSRIPSLLHLVFFLLLTLFAFLLSEAAILTLMHGTPVAQTLASERVQLGSEALTYCLTLTAAWLTLPIFWHQPLLTGLRWNPAAATWRIALLGLAIGFASQGISIFIPQPKQMPIEDFFHHPGLIWFLALFGILLGPLFEEVVFRGFLLPAIANAVDYIRIPRNPDPNIALENLIAWRSSSSFSPLALGIAPIVTSLIFASIHGPQIAWNLPALAVLFAVSYALCLVRLRTHSLAASTLVHCCYNLSIFLSIFIGTGGFRHLDRA
jgi:membrane protease YdiL (CAAX protease family)